LEYKQLSLWGDEFNQVEADKELLAKLNKPKKIKKGTSSDKTDIQAKLKLIEEDVNRILGKYKYDTQIIKTKDELIQYIDKSIENGEIAIDTETNNSLNPLECKIMGGCIYTPGMKNAYIPINHVDIDTGIRLDWQLTEADLNEQFSRLGNTKIIMHNGKFDYQVIKCTCGVKLDCYWDTMIAARILNENEKAALKEQYRMKLNPNQEKYDIEHLFKGLKYEIVSPDLFALYAATDSKITYELYKWQAREFNKPENERIFNVFMNIEMPVVEVVSEMELTGITVDVEYAKLLSERYHNELEEIQSKIDKELEKYSDKISQWRLTDDALYKAPTMDKSTGKQKVDKKGNLVFAKSKSEQLDSPPSVNSPTQLAILLYDVLEIETDIDRSTGKPSRSTGEDALKSINGSKYPICSLILEYRGVNKLINTYVDKLPECVCEKDGRLHAHFNQCGTDTGRFSSTEPKQNWAYL